MFERGRNKIKNAKALETVEKIKERLAELESSNADLYINSNEVSMQHHFDVFY